MVAETAMDQRNRHSAAIFRPAQVNNHILEHQFQFMDWLPLNDFLKKNPRLKICQLGPLYTKTCLA